MSDKVEVQYLPQHRGGIHRKRWQSLRAPLTSLEDAKRVIKARKDMAPEEDVRVVTRTVTYTPWKEVKS